MRCGDALLRCGMFRPAQPGVPGSVFFTDTEVAYTLHPSLLAPADAPADAPPTRRLQSTDDPHEADRRRRHVSNGLDSQRTGPLCPLLLGVYCQPHGAAKAFPALPRAPLSWPGGGLSGQPGRQRDSSAPDETTTICDATEITAFTESTVVSGLRTCSPSGWWWSCWVP